MGTTTLLKSPATNPDGPNPEPQASPISGVLTGLWFVAMPSRDLKRGSMRAETLFGEPILFMRRADGGVFAIKNRCPHRGLPLHHGDFDGHSVGCAYHGWRFGGSGECTLIPSLTSQQQVDVSKIKVGSFPCVDQQGFIWILLPDAKNASAPPLTPPLPDFPDQGPQACMSMVYEGDFGNSMFGLMDPAHIAYVHSAWWMRKKKAELQLKEKHFEPTALGWSMITHQIRNLTPFHKLLGRKVETEITVRLPGLRIERIFGERHKILNVIAMTPIDANRTKVVQALWWTMPGLNFLSPIVSLGARRFLAQDREIIRKQMVGLETGSGQMLVADADAQMKWWVALTREWQKHQQEERAFRNPLKPQTLRFRS